MKAIEIKLTPYDFLREDYKVYHNPTYISNIVKGIFWDIANYNLIKRLEKMKDLRNSSNESFIPSEDKWAFEGIYSLG